MRGRLVGAATGLMLTLLFVGPAVGRSAHAAAGPVSFVLWTGGLAHGASHGVLLHTNGTGQRLRSSPGGVVSSVGAFHPKGAQLAAIRAAAHAAMAGPSFVNHVTPGRVSIDGPYVAATFKTSGHRDAAIAVGVPGPGLAALVAAVNGALNPSQQLVSASVDRRRAHAAALASTAPCESGDLASAAYKNVSLKDATSAGLTKLTSKGGFNADDVAIDAKWKRVPGPITARVNVEVTPPPGHPELVQKFKATVEKQLSGYKLGAGSEAGTPVHFEVNVRTRGTAPTPCFNQIVINTQHDFRSGGEHTELGTDYGITDPGSVEVSRFDPAAWAHETPHLMGLPDKYQDYFQVGSHQYPLPENGLEGKALADALAKFGVKPNQGYLTAKNMLGVAPNDIMGTGSDHGHIIAKDLRALAGFYFIRITGVQGTILANKNVADQNYLAENLNGPSRNELLVPPGGSAHADGIYGYCIDLTRHIPKEGEGLDVVGNIYEQTDPASQALVKVLSVIVNRPHDSFGFFPIAGAQDAIWAITDSNDVFVTADGRGVLTDAGVDPSQTFSFHHIDDPGASSPGSAAYDPASGRLLPPARTLPQRADRRRRGARLAGLTFPHRVTRRSRLLVARLAVANTGTQVVFSLLQGRGRRTRLIKNLGVKHVEPGKNMILLALPRLRPGGYILAATSAAGAAGKRVTFRVTR